MNMQMKIIYEHGTTKKGSILKVNTVERIFSPIIKTNGASCLAVIVRIDNVSSQTRQSDWNSKKFIKMVSLERLWHSYMKLFEANGKAC